MKKRIMLLALSMLLLTGCLGNVLCSAYSKQGAHAKYRRGTCSVDLPENDVNYRFGQSYEITCPKPKLHLVMNDINESGIEKLKEKFDSKMHDCEYRKIA